MMNRSSHQRLTLDHVWVVAALTLIVVGPLITPIPPNDLWFHIATGRQIAQSGAIPTTDSFSYTRFGSPFYNQAWLAQLMLFALHGAGGVPLLLLFHAFLVLLAYGLLLRLCVRRSGNLRLAIAVFLATLPVSFADWNVRPQTFAFPLFAGFLYVLTAYRLGWFNRLWLLPVLMMVWVNVHGTFPLGLALIGATFAGMLGTQVVNSMRKVRLNEAHAPSQFGLRPLVIWGVVTALATLVNPTGPGVLGYVRNLTGNNAVTGLVMEWAPPTIRDAGGLILFVFLIVGALVLIYARRKPDLTDVLMGLPLLWLSLGASRNVVWFAFVAVPIVIHAASSLVQPREKSAPGASVLNGMLIGMLALAVVLCLPWVKPLWLEGPQGQLLKNTPVQAVAWLRAQPNKPQRLYHTEAHGSYMTYAAPEIKVFIDPRIELYPYQQWLDYLALNSGHDVDKLTQKYNFDGMLLSKQYQAPLISVIRDNPAWQQQYEDDLVVYFAHR